MRNLFAKPLVATAVFFLFLDSFCAEKRESFLLSTNYLKIFSSAISEFGEPVKLFQTEKGTVEFWIYLNESAKNGSPVFFWGEKAWKNSILMKVDCHKVFYARISSHNWKGKIQSSKRIKLGQWVHIAFEWESSNGLISIEKTKFFINGKEVKRKTIFHNEKSPDKKFLGGKLMDTTAHYILIGAIRNKYGEIDEDLTSNILISQVRISDKARYQKDFVPKAELLYDEATIALISSLHGNPEGIYIKDKVFMKIEIEKRKY